MLKSDPSSGAEGHSDGGAKACKRVPSGEGVKAPSSQGRLGSSDTAGGAAFASQGS